MLMMVIGVAIGLLAGALTAWFLGRRSGTRAAAEEVAKARAEADEVRRHAEAEARTHVQDAEIKARELKIKALAEVEEEQKQQKADAKRAEERVREREEQLEKRRDLLTQKETELQRREAAAERQEKELADKARKIDSELADKSRRFDGELAERAKKADEALAEKSKKVDEQLAEARRLVEVKAGLSRDEAKTELVQQITDESRRVAAIQVKQIEDEARDDAENRAKRIIGIAVQRFAGEHVQERAVSVVHLTSDDMKGRIIGREGRNIRALEAATGVDFIVDDTPETVTISGFDPVRREIARLSLEKLMQDGRIHPTRIEEIVSKATVEVNKIIKESGDQAILELGLARVHPEMVRLLGQLRFRYSYGQNVLKHSVECGFIAGLIASELKINVRKARRAGLFHDIGKAMSHEVEGSHAVVGAQFARKHGEEPVIVNAIGAHHEDEEPQSVLAHIVAASDALSGARPGARREMLESYIKRLESIENICVSFPGVEKSYAIQAGREVRVLVKNEEVSDEMARLLSQDIAKRIESELTYPGQIRVTVIRETRAMAVAK